MPIEFSPPRRLIDAFIRLRERKRQSAMRTGPHLTTETIETSNGNGTYQIKGKDVGQAGEAQLRAGEIAVVAWKDHNTPTVVLAHSARRIKPTSIAPPGVGGIVEELFISGPSGNRDIYYRNDKQVTKLDIRKLFPEDPTRLRWGFTDNAFVVLCEPSNTFWVFRLTRSPSTIAGANKQTATLKQTINLATVDITLLDFGLESHSSSSEIVQEIHGDGSGGFALGPATPFAITQDFSGHLIVKVDLAQLQAGQSNVDDGSVNDFIPNTVIIGADGQYRLFQFIDDFWLTGNGSEKNPYKVMLALLADYNVIGNGTRTGSSSFLTTEDSTNPPGANKLVYQTLDSKWAGDVHTRAGYIINATDKIVVHSGTGASARTFANNASGGSIIEPILGTVDFFTSLQETTRIISQEAVSLAWSAAQASFTQTAHAANLLDPVASPFILEDPLENTVTGSGSVDPTYYAISGQAKPNNPLFERDGDGGGGTIVTSISTMRMLDFHIISFDTDPTKTRLWAVLRHDSGEFTGIQPEQFIWAVKVVILDGLFAVKHLLTDWTRQIYRAGSGIFDFVVGSPVMLGSSPTHVFWRENIGSAPTGNPGPLSGAQYTQRRRTLLANYKTGDVKVVSQDAPGDTTNQDELDTHHFKVLGEVVDLFYAGKEAERDFVIAWNSKKVPTLDQTTPGYPKEDKQFAAQKALKDLPKDVTVDVGDGTYHGVFDSTVVGESAK